MKKFNLPNILKDRKTLYLVLTIMIVSVFTLSIAYAAMEAVLEIHGNSEVVASSWDIHLDNVKVKSGSVSANTPQISGTSTLSFDVDLNLPGDYYEFTVDVVNEGSIDAMIDSVVKTPNLTTEQAKYIKYEITYENGESISTKQTLNKGTSTPIKVRLEYRKDINVADLPSSTTELSLKLTLVYVQSDGTGSEIKDNGIAKVVTADGDINEIGTFVTIGTEGFYTIGTEGENVKLFSKMNITLDENPIQSSSGGTTIFSSFGAYYELSYVEKYINNYKTKLVKNFGVEVVDARVITYEELADTNTFSCKPMMMCSEKYSWIYSTSYWSSPVTGGNAVYAIQSTGALVGYYYNQETPDTGVRPVIVIPKSSF